MPSSFMDGALDTIVVMAFERGNAAVISVTLDGKNIGMTVLDVAQGWAMPCVPYAGGLLGYHIPQGRVVRLDL